MSRFLSNKHSREIFGANKLRPVAQADHCSLGPEPYSEVHCRAASLCHTTPRTFEGDIQDRELGSSTIPRAYAHQRNSRYPSQPRNRTTPAQHNLKRLRGKGVQLKNLRHVCCTIQSSYLRAVSGGRMPRSSRRQAVRKGRALRPTKPSPAMIYRHVFTFASVCLSGASKQAFARTQRSAGQEVSPSR